MTQDSCDAVSVSFARCEIPAENLESRDVAAFTDVGSHAVPVHIADDSVMTPVTLVSLAEGRQCEKECKSRLAIASPTQASGCRNPGKNFMTLEIFQVGRISVVTLIRTDTTLDHSQEAEKVCSTDSTLFMRPSEAKICSCAHYCSRSG